MCEEERDLVALILLSFGCLVIVNFLWLVLAVPRVGLQFVIVVVPDHTHLLFSIHKSGLPHLLQNSCRQKIFVQSMTMKSVISKNNERIRV